MPTNFPTPWAGSPGVSGFFGNNCGASPCDSGAIRIVNNSPSAVTLNSVVLRLDTCTFDSWPHDVGIPTGAQVILSDMGGAGATGCPNGGILDTSDIGPGGANWAFNCTQSGVIPEVDLTIDGAPLQLFDSGQVLNTGGVDKAECPTATNNNESTQWTPLGNAPCAGATLSLSPPSQTDEVTSTAALTAHLQNGCGNPLTGALVDFAVLSGPNGGVTASSTTDPAGNATFAYTGSTVGIDTVQAAVSTPAGPISSNTATVNWVPQTIMTGRAYALSAAGVIKVAPVADTGNIATPFTTDTHKCRLGITLLLLSARTLCSQVATVKTTVDSSTAGASVANLNVAVPKFPGIALRTVSAGSGTNCFGSNGSSEIGFLKVGTRTLISNLIHPAPNSTINILGIKIILNQQIPVPGGLTVNAAHVIIPNVEDIVVASATSDIHNCH
jgi:hypothetical protein